MSALVTIAFASNDDHGNDTGRIELVNFESSEHGDVSLCCQMRGGQRIRRIGPIASVGTGVVTLYVGRKAFISKEWRACYGNLYWNATGMEPSEAERLLRHLLACGYSVDGYDCDTRFAAIIEAHEAEKRGARSPSTGDATSKEGT